MEPKKRLVNNRGGGRITARRQRKRTWRRRKRYIEQEGREHGEKIGKGQGRTGEIREEGGKE